MQETNLNSTSVDHESSVDTMGRKASEEPERKGTARVWTSSSDSEFSKTIGGGAEEDTAATGVEMEGTDEEGPATGASWRGAAGRPKASLTCDKKAGNWKVKRRNVRYTNFRKAELLHDYCY